MNNPFASARKTRFDAGSGLLRAGTTAGGRALPQTMGILHELAENHGLDARLRGYSHPRAGRQRERQDAGLLFGRLAGKLHPGDQHHRHFV